MFAQILPGVKYQVALVISKRLQIRTLPYVAVTSQLISDTLQTDIKCHWNIVRTIKLVSLFCFSEVDSNYIFYFVKSLLDLSPNGSLLHSKHFSLSNLSCCDTISRDCNVWFFILSSSFFFLSYALLIVYCLQLSLCFVHNLQLSLCFQPTTSSVSTLLIIYWL